MYHTYCDMDLPFIMVMHLLPNSCITYTCTHIYSIYLDLKIYFVKADASCNLTLSEYTCFQISRIFQDKRAMIEGALETASLIATKSPVAVQGTKISLVFSRDHSVQEGLDHVVRYYRVIELICILKPSSANIHQNQVNNSFINIFLLI